MLQAHSFLWHYLWVAPSVLLLVLAYLLKRRGLHRRYPYFVAFAIVSAVEQLTLYVCDLIPPLTAETWWRIFWGASLVEGLVKFALVAKIFEDVFDAYASIARLGKLAIRGIGASLILAAAVAGAFAPASSQFGIINGAHRVEQAIYLVETGLLLFIFIFSAYFKIRIARPLLGISLGLAISACVHLATWAVAANNLLPPTKRNGLDMINMATYHVSVLIWYYFLLVPERRRSKNDRRPPRPPADPPADPPTGPAVEDHLNEWNRELERLLQ
jgi:hypothetical protein